MPLKIAPITHADIPAVVHGVMHAFETTGDVLSGVIGPLGMTPEGHAMSERSWRGMMAGDEARELATKRRESWKLKAVDAPEPSASTSSTGEPSTSGEQPAPAETKEDAKAAEDAAPLAYAQWEIFREEPWGRDGEGKGVNEVLQFEQLQRPDGRWERNRQLAMTVINGLRDRRRELKEAQGPHCHLSVLCSMPGHHKKGAAGMLVKWATDYADEEGVPCIVEASAYAYQNGYYQKHGFEEVEKLVWNDKEEYPEFPRIWCALMVRPPKKKEAAAAAANGS